MIVSTDDGMPLADTAGPAITAVCEDMLAVAIAAIVKSRREVSAAAVERSRAALSRLADQIGKAIGGEVYPSSLELYAKNLARELAELHGSTSS